MSVYIFILIWVMTWGLISNFYSKSIYVQNCKGEGIHEKRAYLLIALIMFSVVIIFAGLRSSVLDTESYIKMFDDYPITYNEAKEYILDPEAREHGFRFLSILIKAFISDNYSVWFSIISVISGLGVMIPLYKYSSKFGMSTFLFVASCQFMWMFNGMRQFLVASIIFACTGWILNKKPIPYIISILLLSTIHISVLIMIPIYFIVQDEPWSKKNILFIVLIMICIFSASKITNLFEDVAEATNYETSIEEFKNVDDGTSYIRILVESVPVILAYIYRNKIKEKATPIINISINMSLIAIGLYVISKITQSGVLLGRLPIYCSLYNLILLPWLITNIFEKNERRLINFLMIICYLGLFYYQMNVIWNGLEYVSDILKIKVK